MNDLLTELSRPSWWVSVVVAGFLVNLVAAYAKPLVDRLAGYYSASRRQRLADKQRRLDRAVSYLLKNPAELVDLKLESILVVLKATIASAMAVLLVQFLEALVGFFYAFSFLRIILVPVYCVAAVFIMAKVRYYFRLRPMLRAYAKAAHTIANRFESDEFPTV